MIDHLIQETRARVKQRLWLISDLQQAEPEKSEYCMTRAMADFQTLNMPCQAVCYLGDSTQGNDLDFLQDMTRMQIRELKKAGAPVYYVPGNHDFDCLRVMEPRGPFRIPFYETVSTLPWWHTSPSLEQMMFYQDMGDFVMVFFPDHAAPDGRWFSSHGMMVGEGYPYTEEDYRRVRDWMESLRRPVFTFSHYAYPGGNREAPLLGRMLPLPANVYLHFYGHAHIGDHEWAGKDCYRKIAAVDHQPIVQINVSSLENFRGSAIRSVFLEYYEDGSVGVLFRNHTLARWDDCYFTNPRKGRQD